MRELITRNPNIIQFTPDRDSSSSGNQATPTIELRAAFGLPMTDQQLMDEAKFLGIPVQEITDKNRGRIRARVEGMKKSLGAPQAADRPGKNGHDAARLETIREELTLHTHTESNGHRSEAVVQIPETASYINMGVVVVRDDIESLQDESDEKLPFHVMPEYRVHYPPTVIQAIGELYAEYNQKFKKLVEANREWDTDYKYATSSDGTPNNYFVQIDMEALSDELLQEAANRNVAEVKEDLRKRIFEIENSLAMYVLLRKIFEQQKGGTTVFKERFGAGLDALREKNKKPIALLAVTRDKYQAMRRSEFGKKDGEELTDDEVRELSGFDRLFGPDEFEAYLAENGGECGYQLYARTSDPVAKLKNPDVVVEVPLLENPKTRRIIKANAITFNIDNPQGSFESRINDTKAYLKAMGMAFEITHEDDITSPAFAEYLINQGVDPELVAAGLAQIYLKPEKGVYGCYGQINGAITEKGMKKKTRKGLRDRGTYVAQPRINIPVLVNNQSGDAFTAIDRNFFHFVDGKPIFMGGFRSLVPLTSVEAQKGRNHGTDNTHWVQVQD